jgi:hypothetical protein
MAMRDTGVKIRFAFVRLRRKIALYFTLWFLALLTGVSLIVYVIFINPTVYSLKIWSVVLVVMLSVKLAYDLASAMKKEYADFARHYILLILSSSSTAAMTWSCMTSAPSCCCMRWRCRIMRCWSSTLLRHVKMLLHLRLLLP